METPQSVNKTQNRDQCRDQATRKEGRTSTQDSFLFVPKIVCSCRVQVGKSMRASDMNLISTWCCCLCIYFFLSIFSSSLHYIAWLDLTLPISPASLYIGPASSHFYLFWIFFTLPNSPARWVRVCFFTFTKTKVHSVFAKRTASCRVHFYRTPVCCAVLCCVVCGARATSELFSLVSSYNSNLQFLKLCHIKVDRGASGSFVQKAKIHLNDVNLERQK